MPSRMTSWSCVALLAAFLLSSSTPASAQLGRLKKIATDVVKDAAKDGTDGKAPGAKVDYIVTEERATAVLAVLTPVVERTRKAVAYSNEKKAYETKSKAFTECLDKAVKSMTSPDMSFSTSPAGIDMAQKQAAYGMTVQKAQAAKNYVLLIASMDSGTVLMTQLAAHFVKNLSCGSVPYKPAALIIAEADRMAQAASGAPNREEDYTITVPTAQRAGMTQGQFGRIREAMAIWSLQKSGQLPASAYKFTDAEQTVLNGKSAQLAALAPLFKSGAMMWQNWGDIATW